MLRSTYVHFLNKFPSAHVVIAGNYVAATARTGELLMRVGIDGLGCMVDQGREFGALYNFCNSPIPKDCRHMKMYRDGSIKPAEECAERKKRALELEAQYGYVPSDLQFKWQKKEKVKVPVEKEMQVEREVEQEVDGADGQKIKTRQKVWQNEKVRVIEEQEKAIGGIPSALEAISAEKGLGRSA